MTPRQRRALVEKPFPPITNHCTIHPVKRWAGVQLHDEESFFHCFTRQMEEEKISGYIGRAEETKRAEMDYYSLVVVPTNKHIYDATK